MNQSQNYTSLGQQRIPSPNSYTDWLPGEFQDDNIFLDSSLDQPLNLTRKHLPLEAAEASPNDEVAHQCM